MSKENVDETEKRPSVVFRMEQPSLFVAGFEKILLDGSRAAVRASERAETPRDGGGHAMAAILLAGASVEALLGTWIAVFRSQYSINDDTIAGWRGRGPSQIVKDVLSRLVPPVAVGDMPWYQKLVALQKIRNAVAHYLPEPRTAGTWPEEIAPYIANGIITPSGNETMDWTSRILESTVAEQIVGIAEEVTQGFMDTAWKKPGD